MRVKCRGTRCRQRTWTASRDPHPARTLFGDLAGRDRRRGGSPRRGVRTGRHRVGWRRARATRRPRRAARARTASVAAGLVVASYGSYVFAGSVPDRDEMDVTLDTAFALGAPNVRVWAGFGVEQRSQQYRAVVDGLAAFCSLADARELTVGLEFHGGTPTATVAGTPVVARHGRRAEPLHLLAAAVLAGQPGSFRRRRRSRRVGITALASPRLRMGECR